MLSLYHTGRERSETLPPSPRSLVYSHKEKKNGFLWSFMELHFFVLSQIKEYLFLRELSHVCINVSSLLRTALHHRQPVLSAELDLKKETSNELVPMLLLRSNLRRDRCSQALFILKHRPRCIPRTTKLLLSPSAGVFLLLCGRNATANKTMFTWEWKSYGVQFYLVSSSI